MAVGDSFTFGEDVNDDETWPANLERITNRRVVNAGVGGFGLDQTVLRAEQLIGIYAPDILIVGFIAADVERTEWTRQMGQRKPYFMIDDMGRLQFHPYVLQTQTFLQQLLGISIVTRGMFQSFVDGGGPEYIKVHNRGKEVACLLMERLADLGRAHSTRIILLAQPEVPDEIPQDVEVKDGVLACAVANHLITLDLFPALEHLRQEQRRGLYYPDHGHMTPAGNQLVATEIAHFLAQPG